jgi:ATP-binding cassette subfamily B (MDR/TAP) protein 1
MIVLSPLTLTRIVGCLGGASGNPIQSYFFAQSLNVTVLTGKALADASAHWALMFFILAIGIAAGYFILGWSSNSLAMVSITSMS